ncbi:transcriptional regulator, CopG family [Balnearium lithotrophicum]|uniref:Putative nickel-responsive regulator n=1 Tax=Balnearium lithotrophicum TaxID=223788 RepID=A0A521BEV5_9BACT|nr:nickel-responsive transcriptional regulator NikR [Balnearium lithotrophicum]SMO45481.1 transcriptional regulator, CopG family [Balnearium lithotrophicum]
MGRIVRLTVSLEEKLFEKFEKFIEEKGYLSRSEAIRDLIRAALIEKDLKPESFAFGTITVVYDHHQKDLVDRLTEIEHNYLENIISTMHIHIDHHHCLEVIAVKGRVKEIKELADKITSLKGVKHSKLVFTGIEP